MELPALGTYGGSRAVGERGFPTHQLPEAPDLHFKSLFSSAVTSAHSSQPTPLHLVSLLESLSPVIMSPTTPSAVLQPSHTDVTALISLLSWACPFPRAQALRFSDFPPVCLHHSHAQGYSSAQWPQRKGKRLGGYSVLACSPGPSDIREGRTFPLSLSLPPSSGFCRGLRWWGPVRGSPQFSQQMLLSSSNMGDQRDLT